MNLPKRSEVEQFYGRIQFGRDGRPTERWERATMKEIRLPYPMRLAWDTKETINRITVHRLVVPKLTKALDRVREFYGDNALLMQQGADLFSGAYMFSMNGKGFSLPSYGIVLTMEGAPSEVQEIFAEEGWAKSGRFGSKTAVSFEAVSD